MDESQPKGRLVKMARQMLAGFVILRLEDTFTSGNPDIAAAGLNFVSWWEVKLADPTFTSKGIQEDTMVRLDAVSFARYIIYELDKKTGDKSVRIVRPCDFKTWKTVGFSVADWTHQWVVENILRAHASKGKTEF